jgi:hypothetical protein
MTSVTLSLPDDTYRQLAEIARLRGVSIDQLFDGMAAHLVAKADAEARFRTRAQRGQGKTECGLDLLSQTAGDESTC